MKTRNRGFVLAEVLVVVLVSSLILAVLASSVRALMLHSISLGQHADMTAQGKKTLTYFTEDVRVATDILVLESDRLVLDKSLISGVSDLVEYEYFPVTQSFVRTINYNTAIEEEILLMDGLVSLTMDYLTILGDSTTKPIEAKKIKFTADLTRGSNGEIELNRQIATQVVMRNRIMSN